MRPVDTTSERKAEAPDPASIGSAHAANATNADAAAAPNASSYPEILTTAMAAEMLHVHVEYLRRMVREARIPAHRFPGGREIRFLRDELIAWVREQPGEDRSPSAADKAR